VRRPDPAILDAINRMADEYGIPRETALAFAERESSFNPQGTSGTPLSSAYGLFQLLKAERARYGGSSDDPYEQASAWGRYIQGTRDDMKRILGRDPSGSELYLGHLIGGPRAGRILAGKIGADTPIQDVMSAKELAANPFMVKARTAGGLSSSVLADMDRRQARWGGDGAARFDPGAYGAAEDLDLGQYHLPSTAYASTPGKDGVKAFDPADYGMAEAA